MPWFNKLRRREASEDHDQTDFLSYTDLLEQNADLQFELERMRPIFDKADTFMALLRAVDGKGGQKVAIQVDSDDELARQIAQAAWELQSALFGGPAPVPVRVGATIH